MAYLAREPSHRDMFYHVLIERKPGKGTEIHVLNMGWDHLVQRVLNPYRTGGWITLHGRSVEAVDVDGIRIISTTFKLRMENVYLPEHGYIYVRGERYVTDCLILGPPGYQAQKTATVETDPPSLIDVFDALIEIDAIRLASRQLFADAHYQNAVEDAFKALESAVARRCGASDYGASLMRRAFGGEQPVIALTELETESQKRVQEGYSHLFAGSMMAIRNPRAHGFSIDEPGEALGLIMLAQHLMKTLHSATTLQTDRPGASE